MPAAAAGSDQRARTCQAMGGGELSDGLLAGGAVDVQDVEAVSGGQADVGLGLLGPPGQHAGPVVVASLSPWGTRLPRGCLPGWPQLGSRHEQPVPTTGCASCP